MATYNVQRSRGGLGVAVADAASPDTQTDLQLVGQNAVSYGLDVAQSFFFLLENFAKIDAPANKILGQLWYDITADALTVKVWNGSTWDEMAPLELGSTEGALARWDEGDKTWLEDIRITTDGSGLFNIVGPTPGNSVSFQHDDTNLDIVGTSTVDINITSGITAVNLPEITLTTVLDETYGGTGVITYATGDILFASGVDVLVALTAGADGEILTLASGVPTWAASGAAVSQLDDLSDVIITSPDANSILYRVGSEFIDSVAASFGWDGSNLIATNVNSIAAADLIDRATPGTLAATTFSGDITAQADILLGDSAQILFGTGTDVAVDFDGSDFVISGIGDFNILGFAAVTSDTPIKATKAAGAQLRAIGTNANTTTNEAFVSVFTVTEGQEQLRMGTVAASNFTEVRSLVQDLNLYATNTLVFNLNTTQTTITAGAATAMNWHAVSGNDTTSSAGVFDDGGAERNVGFNETPLITVSGAITIDANHIGKFLSRTASTSRVITLSAETDIPVGGSFIAHNDHTTGTLTIATTQTLQWIDGLGSSPPTGTRTIAYNSVVTIRKKSSTVWQIWGNGIS